MSKDDDDDKKDLDVEILDFHADVDDSVSSEDAEVTIKKTIEKFEFPHYKPEEEDLKTIDSLVERYPDQNPLDIIKCLKVLEQGREDKGFFEDLLERMGIVETEVDESDGEDQD